MDKPEEIDLLEVAAAISDGKKVGWGQLQQPGTHDAHASAVLQEMALLERIASFHQTGDEPGTQTDDRLASYAEAPAQLTWGHFRLLGKIGEGTFGTVYRAQDTKLESEVALKLLQPTGSLSSRVLNEARRLARVRHPNVVQVYGTDLIDGRVGIWMELVKGSTLANLLQTHGPFGAREAAGIGVDLCRALAAVHGAGLMHGDVKATNVMREAGGRTVLMDFGTGKDLGLDVEVKEQRANDFAGTPLYVAPEVFEGQPRTLRSEIYSLGVLLYHLVTDAYPVEGKSQNELEEAHRCRKRKRLRDARPDLSDEFTYAVERALSVDPRERYASAGAFEAALVRWVGAGPDPKPPQRWMATGIGAAIAAIALVGGTYWIVKQNVSAPTSGGASASVRELAQPAAPGAPVALESAYKIDTALYRMRGATELRLRPGERVAPGDGVFVKLRVSVPAYVYIVNEDDQGEAYLLFPLPGQSVGNPLPAGTINRIPGTGGRADFDWQVTSVGGREHFLIFASPERMPALEEVFAALPRPELGRTLQPPRLPDEAIRRLRGVGGLTPKPPQGTSAKLAPIFSTPLGETEETARGLWVRQLTIDNPAAGR